MEHDDKKLSETLAGMVEKDMVGLRESHDKFYNEAVKMAFQLNILFLSGWVVLGSTGKLNPSCTLLIYGPILTHILCLALLAYIVFKSYLQSRKSLFEYLDFAEAINEFNYAVAMDKQDVEDVPGGSTPRQDLVFGVEQWRKFQRIVVSEGNQLLCVGKVTMGIVIFALIFSTVGILSAVSFGQ